MDKKAMLKQAATVLREKQKEIEDLHEKMARAEKAEQIVRHLIENHELMADEVLFKLG
jgi:cell fate regulator YaaT (PSP1 superfamily)